MLVAGCLWSRYVHAERSQVGCAACPTCDVTCAIPGSYLKPWHTRAPCSGPHGMQSALTLVGTAGVQAVAVLLAGQRTDERFDDHLWVRAREEGEAAVQSATGSVQAGELSRKPSGADPGSTVTGGNMAVCVPPTVQSSHRPNKQGPLGLQGPKQMSLRFHGRPARQALTSWIRVHIRSTSWPCSRSVSSNHTTLRLLPCQRVR